MNIQEKSVHALKNFCKDKNLSIIVQNDIKKRIIKIIKVKLKFQKNSSEIGDIYNFPSAKTNQPGEVLFQAKLPATGLTA